MLLLALCIPWQGPKARNQSIPKAPNVEVETAIKAFKDFGFTWSTQEEVTNRFSSYKVNRAVRFKDFGFGSSKEEVLFISVTDPRHIDTIMQVSKSSYITKGTFGLFWLGGEPTTQDYNDASQVLRTAFPDPQK